MPTYLTPGVYVEEVPPAARPIAGVSTSTAGLVGVVEDGVTMPLRPGRTGLKPDGNPEPADHYTVAAARSPTFVTSWAEFKNSFGDFQQGNLALAHAVYGFFNNGGTRCYVVRVGKGDELTDPTPLLDLLEPHDDVSIVAVPGATSKIQHDKILTHCSNLGDRVAVLDGDPGASLSAPPTAIAPAGRSAQGSFGAVYFPNIVVFDPLAPKDGAAAGTQPITTIAPSGHIAGIYARTDATRGVFKAPANEPVLGALDVSLRLSDRHQAKLNPEGVNVLRFFNGTVTVWGARTQADEAHSEYRYVSTRRFFNFLRSSIIRGTQFVVFEPNSPALWQRIVRSVSDFLLGQWRDGALFGDTPKQAFFVRCDWTTNPRDVREAGQVVTEIGIAIVKPAEFVIFRIEQQAGA